MYCIVIAFYCTVINILCTELWYVVIRSLCFELQIYCWRIEEQPLSTCLWFWNEKCKNKPSLKLPKRLQIYPFLLPMSTEQMILYFKKILCWHLKKKRKLLKIFCKMRENLCLRYIEFLILNLESKTLCKISFNINAAYDQHDGLYALFLCTLILDPNHYVKQ